MVTQQYTESNINLYPGGFMSREEPYEPEQWRDVTREFAGIDASRIRILELRVTDLRTGWGQVGDVLKTSASTLWQAYKGQLTLPPLITQTTLGTAMNNGAMFHCYTRVDATGSVAHDSLFMGGGSAGASNNFVSFKETSVTDPTPTNNSGVATANASTHIVSMSWMPDKPAGGAFAILYGYDNSTAPTFYTVADGSAGATGTGHANLANLWGAQITNINASSPGVGGILLYAGTSMYYLSLGATFSDAPTQVLSGIPGGGTSAGVRTLRKNWMTRAHWLWPKANRTTTAVGTSMHFDHVSTNLEGTGPELHPTMLNRLLGLVWWGDTAIRWDQMRVTQYDGADEIDLHILDGRERNSDYRWAVGSPMVQGGELYCWVIRMDMTQSAGTLGAGVLQLEKYLGVPGRWANVSGPISAAASNAGSVSTASARETIYGEIDWMHTPDPNGIPVSKRTGFWHMNMYNSTKWDRGWLPPEGINPFYHFVKTGSGNEIAQQWGASGTWYSNKFPVPRSHGKRSVVFCVDWTEADLVAGGTDCVPTVSIGRQTGTTHVFDGTNNYNIFNAGHPKENQIAYFPTGASFSQLQFSLSVTQGADTYKTPNLLPLRMLVMTFLDGNDREPVEVFADAGWELTQGGLRRTG